MSNRYVKEGKCYNCYKENDRYPNRVICTSCAGRISKRRVEAKDKKKQLSGEPRRRCVDCGEWKFLFKFSLGPKNNNGRSIVCNHCRSEKKKSGLVWCHGCSEFLSSEMFTPRKKSGNFYSRCVQCINGYKFGITGKEYRRLLEECGGRCLACSATEGNGGRGLSLDHDHDTGMIRGFLCGRCNTIIGLANDDQNLLHRLIAYLDKHAKRYKILAE